MFLPAAIPAGAFILLSRSCFVVFTGCMFWKDRLDRGRESLYGSWVKMFWKEVYVLSSGSQLLIP